jgi:aminopeptidase-like protein
VNDDYSTEMLSWLIALLPVNRSLTGDGNRITLNFLKKQIPELLITEIPSGTTAFDWTVPDEWNVKAAYIEDSKGNRIVDFAKSNLHVVGYSLPVDKTVSRAELNQHLHSLPDQPTAIPYVTSYYSKYWGFCISEEERALLKDEQYRVFIDSTLQPGNMTIGEILIPGDTTDEILLSTYICHPSMANNELSGPVLAVALAKWLKTFENRKYTYRIVFLPETIGSIYYISQHFEELRNIKAGWVLTCMGDERSYSYLPSRDGNTLADRVSLQVLKDLELNFKNYSWFDRGSDERQYCAPGIDLPVCSVMRTKYGEYPEYHTSLDNLDVVTSKGLGESFKIMAEIISTLEYNDIYRINVLGEPQLGKRGLYPNLGTKNSGLDIRDQMNVISYLDGYNDLLEIAVKCNLKFSRVRSIVETLSKFSLLDSTIQI